MYSKKDDNENKGRRSGKGPKLSKGMKKAARQEKKTARKNARKVKKIGKKLGKAASEVLRFQGSQPVIGKIAGGSAYASGFETRKKLLEGQTSLTKSKKNQIKKKELTRGQKRSYELRDAHS